jgi:hypothetical protein
MLRITATVLALCCALPVAAQSAPVARQNPQARAEARGELEQLRNELRELRQTIERLCQSMATAHGQNTAPAAPRRAMSLQGQRAMNVTPPSPPQAVAAPVAPQPPRAATAPTAPQGMIAAPLRVRTVQPGQPSAQGAPGITGTPLRAARTAQPGATTAPLTRVSVPSFQNHAGCTCDCPCCQQARRTPQAGVQGQLAPMRVNLRTPGQTGDRNCAPRRAAVQRVEVSPETPNPPAPAKKAKVKKDEDKKTLISV